LEDVDMRTFLLGLLLGCLVTSVLFAMPQSGKPRETIWLGTDLTLGMPEETVIKNLAESAYNVRKESPPKGLRAKGITSMWGVDRKGDGKYPSVGVIAFAAGKLDSVAKYLLPPDGDEVELGRQLYFAMRAWN
jgi:hypothetical protein